jgi:hypothetical protein
MNHGYTNSVLSAACDVFGFWIRPHCLYPLAANPRYNSLLLVSVIRETRNKFISMTAYAPTRFCFICERETFESDFAANENPL